MVPGQPAKDVKAKFVFGLAMVDGTGAIGINQEVKAIPGLKEIA
jgi:hypothetical protein